MFNNDQKSKSDGSIKESFEFLTDNTREQSLDRSGGKLGNKGVECAVAAIKMAALRQF